MRFRWPHFLYILPDMRSLLLFALGIGMIAADPQAELMQADRDFARDTAARGLDGWMSWFHEDALANAKTGVIKGKPALRSYYAQFIGTPGFQLVWAPTHAEASPDGKLGYTIGTGTAITKKADGTEDRKPAHYLTVWRRGADGKWRVVTDLGN